MIRYGYNNQLRPPAPFVHVTISCPESGKSEAEIPAQLDSAADRTVIPQQIVDALELVPLDEIRVGGFGGQVLLLPTYRVTLTVRGLRDEVVEVIAHEDELVVLLGRDVMNRYNISLLGPSLRLEIQP